MEWHKKLTEKTLKSWGLSNYAGMWISFVKGVIIGGIAVHYFF
tara:strand:+ start:86 stop:214 length:129 start_codon:yes stop_codon:yes gene_type:complete